MSAHSFSLEQYALAQALDYFFLMDEDVPALTITGEYPNHAEPHPILTEDRSDAIEGDSRVSA